MSKTKKHKIAKLTDEQYVNYIMSLKNDAAVFTADGKTVVPDGLVGESGKNDD